MMAKPCNRLHKTGSMPLLEYTLPLQLENPDCSPNEDEYQSFYDRQIGQPLRCTPISTHHWQHTEHAGKVRFTDVCNGGVVRGGYLCAGQSEQREHHRQGRGRLPARHVGMPAGLQHLCMHWFALQPHPGFAPLLRSLWPARVQKLLRQKLGHGSPARTYAKAVSSHVRPDKIQSCWGVWQSCRAECDRPCQQHRNCYIY